MGHRGTRKRFLGPRDGAAVRAGHSPTRVGDGEEKMMLGIDGGEVVERVLSPPLFNQSVLSSPVQHKHYRNTKICCDRYFLVGVEYERGIRTGPPRIIAEEEVAELFGCEKWDIEALEKDFVDHEMGMRDGLVMRQHVWGMGKRE